MFDPTIKEALVISMSAYTPGGKWSELPASKNDGRQMRDFLEDNGFDVDHLHDKSLEEINDSYKNIVDAAKNLVKFKVKGLFMIYYSGHGVLQDAETKGVTINSEMIPLDEMIRNLSIRANSYCIGFFDCCREVVQSKGATKVVPPSFGQLYTIYGAAPKQLAMAVQGKTSGLSEATDSFISHMDSNTRDFPLCLLDWNAKTHGRVEIIDKANLMVKFSENTDDDNKPSENIKTEKVEEEKIKKEEPEKEENTNPKESIKEQNTKSANASPSSRKQSNQRLKQKGTSSANLSSSSGKQPTQKKGVQKTYITKLTVNIHEKPNVQSKKLKSLNPGDKITTSFFPIVQEDKSIWIEHVDGFSLIKGSDGKVYLEVEYVKKNSDFAKDKTLNDKFTAAVKDNNKNEVLRMTTMKLSKNQQKYFLFFAARHGSYAGVLNLLDRGANPNRKMMKFGDTPLHGAIRGKHVNIAKLLIERGAKPDIKNKKGKSAEDEAKDAAIHQIIFKK